MIMETSLVELENIVNEKIIRSGFERQFKEIESFPFANDLIGVWDMQPDMCHSDESVPLLYVPGWGATPETYKDGLRVHYESGRRIISLSFPFTYVGNHEPGLPKSLSIKLSAIEEVLRIKNITRIDAVGYSEGSIVVLALAERYPDRLRNIILQGVPGLTGNISYMGIIVMELNNLLQFVIYRFLQATKEEKRVLMVKGKSVVNWMKKVGFFRSISDGIDILRIEPHKLITRVLNKNKHNIGVIAATKDRIVHFKKLRRKVDELRIRNFYEVKGGHHSFEVKAAECASLTEKMLQDFECNYVRI